MKKNKNLPHSAYKYLEKIYFLLPQKIRSYLPFLYFDIINRMLPKDTKTILDMGCSIGYRIDLIKNKSIVLTGIDVWEPSYGRAKKTSLFDNLILGNIVDYSFKEKYDVVLLLFTLEHLTRKDGMKVLDKIEEIAYKKIFISIPNGFMKQEAFEDVSGRINPYQEHKSGNWEKELLKRGYTLRGLDGWSGFRKENTGIKGNKITYPFYLLLNVFSQIFIYFWWKWAVNLLAVKEKII